MEVLYTGHAAADAAKGGDKMIGLLRRIFGNSGELAHDTRVEARNAIRSIERIQEKRAEIQRIPTVTDFPISGFIRDVPPRRRRKAVVKHAS